MSFKVDLIKKKPQYQEAETDLIAVLSEVVEVIVFRTVSF